MPPKKRTKLDDGSAAGSDDFPFDLSTYKKLSINPFTTEALSAEQQSDLEANIELCRSVIVFFTSCGSASGYGGHTGGAFDTVPEVCLLDAFFRACPDKFVPIFFDEAGHRVATQYLLAALNGDLNPSVLKDYRKGHSKLPGHPELGLTPGIKFSSGRLGHMWGHVNGVALANPEKIVVCLGSDGSQMEGNDAEAARLAVAQNLNVKLFVDDNNVTITGHPAEYLPGYTVEGTLAGHGLAVEAVNGEEINGLYTAMRKVIGINGAAAVVSKRSMAPGIPDVEGTNHGHDAVAPKSALPYLESRGHTAAMEIIKGVTKTSDPYGAYQGSGDKVSNRKTFGKTLVGILDKMTAEERKARVLVIDSDLGSSTSIQAVQGPYPECYVQSGIMERGNFLAAAGFGMDPEKQGIFSTFGAFLEMVCSEITMARLNNCNVLAHFSHCGVDDMADNTCHFGINMMFADNGLSDQYTTRLYFPADANQMKACVESVFPDKGLRFVFSTRSTLPTLLGEDDKPLYGEGYTFKSGVDDIVRTGTMGYIVSFGDAVYRALDAVCKLKKEGIDIGLINKSTLNVVDEDSLKLINEAGICLVVEPLSQTNGLGSKFGSWLLTRGMAPKFDHIGVFHEGCGGLWEQAYHQKYDSESIVEKIMSML